MSTAWWTITSCSSYPPRSPWLRCSCSSCFSSHPLCDRKRRARPRRPTSGPVSPAEKIRWKASRSNESTPAGLFLPAFFFGQWPGLILFDEFLDAAGIRFAVAVAGQWVRPARRLDQNVRPDQPGFYMNRGDLLNADADFVPAEPGSFAPHHGLFADFDDRGKEKIAFCPPAGLECFHSPPSIDRKSTRLNSSHTVISYAVFCLKKKKK